MTLKPGFAYQTWAECDLRERPVAEFVQDEISISLHAYEIKTILFKI